MVEIPRHPQRASVNADGLVVDVQPPRVREGFVRNMFPRLLAAEPDHPHLAFDRLAGLVGSDQNQEPHVARRVGEWTEFVGVVHCRGEIRLITPWVRRRG